jgi:hypothetical protein
MTQENTQTYASDDFQYDKSMELKDLLVQMVEAASNAPEEYKIFGFFTKDPDVLDVLANKIDAVFSSIKDEVLPTAEQYVNGRVIVMTRPKDSADDAYTEAPGIPDGLNDFTVFSIMALNLAQLDMTGGFWHAKS